MDKIRLMRLRIAGRVAGALMLLVGQSAMASELSYTFVELGYVGGTLDYFGSDADYDGFALSGGAEIGEMFSSQAATRTAILEHLAITSATGVPLVDSIFALVRGCMALVTRISTGLLR